MKVPAASRQAARRMAVVSIAFAVTFVAGGTGVQADARSSQGTTDGVSAILLDPYTGCAVTDAWGVLNDSWSRYGSVPLSITTGGHFCKGKFTLGELEASGADTIILDSTSFLYTLKPSSIAALQAYLNEGHTLVGTDTVFEYKTKNVNNSLAPLFGLQEQPVWYKDGLQGISPQYNLSEQDPDAAVLLRDVPNPYASSLYGVGQKPAEKKWLSDVLNGARYIGTTDDTRNAISVYDAPTYTAIYISDQAAFKSTPDDMQFLYNAVIYPNAG